MVPLVDHFITLDIKTPIGLRIDGSKSLVGLLGEYPTSFAESIIPNGIQDTDLIRTDLFDQFTRIVVGATDCHYHLVTERKDGPDRLHDRVVEADRVADERETADKHGQTPV